MRVVRATTGPFQKRPFYELQEIEEICGTALKRQGLYPEQPEAIRIDRFVEKEFGITPCYEELPKGVLGYTEFGSNGVESIYVDVSLEVDPKLSSQRRVRTTIAHEAGHGLLHAHLYCDDRELSLFEEPKRSKVLCRDEDVVTLGAVNAVRRYDDRWWEYQANRAMAALLLPISLIHLFIRSVITTWDSFGIPVIDPDKREYIVSAISDCFDVNPVVSRLRVAEIFRLDASQFSL